MMVALPPGKSDNCSEIGGNMKKFVAYFLLAGLLAPAFALDMSKKLEISVAVWDVQSAFADSNDGVLKFVQDKFNVKFKPVAMTWDDWNQKVRLWAASGDMPDIVANDFATRDPAEQLKMVRQGVLRALPDDLSAYPYIKANLGLSDVKPLAIGGKFYEIPRMAATEAMQGYGVGGTLIVRKDWFKKLGITKHPDTFEEFVALGKKLTDKSKGIYGLTLAGANKLGTLVQVEDPGMGVGWVKDASGKWVPHSQTKNFVAGLVQVSRLLKENVLDPDAFLLKDKVGLDKFSQGKAAMVVFNGGPSHLKQLYDRWSTYPDNPPFADAVMQIPFWKTSDGKRYYPSEAKWWSASYFSTKVDDEKMNRILAIYDYLSSPEGFNLVLYGLEGVDYKKNGDKLVITRAKDEKGQLPSLDKKYPSIGSMFTYLANWTADVTMWQRSEANYAAYGPALDVAMDSHDWRMKNLVAYPINWKISFLTSVAQKDKFVGFGQSNPVYEDAVRVISQGGDIPTLWAKVLESYRTQGMDKITDEVNQAVK